MLCDCKRKGNPSQPVIPYPQACSSGNSSCFQGPLKRQRMQGQMYSLAHQPFCHFLEYAFQWFGNHSKMSLSGKPGISEVAAMVLLAVQTFRYKLDVQEM